MGISKGGLGSGLGIIATPLVALTVPAPQAAAILLPILLVMDAVGLFAYRGVFDRRHLGLLLAGGIAGTVLGALTFRYFSDAMIRAILGAMALAFVAHRVRSGLASPAVAAPSRAKGLFWSTISGLASTISHAGGPPLSVYLLPLRLDKAVLVGTTVIFFAVINAVKLVPYAWLGLIDTRNLLTSALLLPLTPLGVWIGLRFVRRVPQALFYRLFNLGLLLTGCKLLWDGLR